MENLYVDIGASKVIKRKTIQQNIYHPAMKASFFFQIETPPESHQAFEVAEARTSGLVILVLSRFLPSASVR